MRILEGRKAYPDPSFDPIIGNVYSSFFLNVGYFSSSVPCLDPVKNEMGDEAKD